jgi:hypothetical protein
VKERGVVAASDGPEKRVADRLAPEGRRAVGGQQETGRPILILDRVVQDGQVHERHALHAQQHVARDRVVVEVDDHRVARHFPAWRRLHARRKAATREAVRPRADLLDRVAVEVHVRILVAELHAIHGVAERHDPRRLVKRAGALGDAVFHSLGGNAPFRPAEHHVAGCDDPEGRLGEEVNFVGEEAGPGADLDVDLSGEPAMIG